MSEKRQIGVYGMVPIALLQDPNITINMLRVYGALASFQGANSECYPKRDKICERSGLKAGAVSKAITDLVEAGWVQRIRRGASHQSNMYTVFMDVIDEETPISESLEHPDSSDNAGSPSDSDIPPIRKRTQEKNTIAETQKTDVVVHQPDPGKELGKEILKAFTDENPITQKEYGREAKAARDIAEMVLEMAPRDASRASQIVLDAFRHLRSTDAFWGRHPFRASRLASTGVWGFVIEHMKSQNQIQTSNTTSTFSEGIW